MKLTLCINYQNQEFISPLFSEVFSAVLHLGEGDFLILDVPEGFVQAALSVPGKYDLQCQSNGVQYDSDPIEADQQDVLDVFATFLETGFSSVFWERHRWQESAFQPGEVEAYSVYPGNNYDERMP